MVFCIWLSAGSVTWGEIAFWSGSCLDTPPVDKSLRPIPRSSTGVDSPLLCTAYVPAQIQYITNSGVVRIPVSFVKNDANIMRRSSETGIYGTPVFLTHFVFPPLITKKTSPHIFQMTPCLPLSHQLIEHERHGSHLDQLPKWDRLACHLIKKRADKVCYSAPFPTISLRLASSFSCSQAESASGHLSMNVNRWAVLGTIGDWL